MQCFYSLSTFYASSHKHGLREATRVTQLFMHCTKNNVFVFYLPRTNGQSDYRAVFTVLCAFSRPTRRHMARYNRLRGRAENCKRANVAQPPAKSGNSLVFYLARTNGQSDFHPVCTARCVSSGPTRRHMARPDRSRHLPER